MTYSTLRNEEARDDGGPHELRSADETHTRFFLLRSENPECFSVTEDTDDAPEILNGKEWLDQHTPERKDPSAALTQAERRAKGDRRRMELFRRSRTEALATDPDAARHFVKGLILGSGRKQLPPLSQAEAVSLVIDYCIANSISASLLTKEIAKHF